jgi:hypothetical protein
VLAAIAADIRSGVSPVIAVTSRDLTEAAWRTAQAAVVGDPVKRQAFETELQSLLRSRGR